MSDVIDLAAAREARESEEPGLKKCRCGGAWWSAVVVFEDDGHVSGYSTDHVACRSCGARAWWL